MFLECRPLPFLENSNSIGFNIAIKRSSVLRQPTKPNLGKIFWNGVEGNFTS